MELVDQPSLPPGQCFLTGADAGVMLDTGYNIDEATQYGRVYLSTDFIREAAGMLGWISPDDYKHVADTAKGSTETLVEAQDRLGTLRGTVRTFLDSIESLEDQVASREDWDT